MRLTIKVIPGAKKTEVVERMGTEWKIRLAAPPVDGKANEVLIAFLAELFDTSKSQIQILRGHAGKIKVVEIEQ